MEDPSGDGKSDDEVIYPFDFRQVGHIGYDEMHRIMVQPLQPAYGLPPSSIHATFVGYEISDPFILHMQSEVWIN